MIPVFDNKENYNISDQDFGKIIIELTSLFNEFNLGLYKYDPKKKTCNRNECWEDYFDLLSEEETKLVFSRKEFWLGNNDMPAFFIATR